MLESMRQLALDWLQERLDGKGDPEAWYGGVRAANAGDLFPWLVESSDKITRYYTLRADPEALDTAILELHEVRDGDALRLPFNQPSGSQSAALGPVIKRSPGGSGKAPGPSPKIQQTTLAAFEAIAGQGQPWSAYFAEALACLRRPRVRWNGQVLGGGAADTALGLAISVLPEKQVVFLAFLGCQGRDKWRSCAASCTQEGRLPGDVPEYVAYLQAVLAKTKYAAATQPRQDSTCALCGKERVEVYPNALSGAGLNLSNMDRHGAFPGVDPEDAWKGYSLCLPCADLLYIYKNHLAREFQVTVAGERALVIPAVSIEPERRRVFMGRLRKLLDGIGREQVTVRENRLIAHLSHDVALTSLTFLWAGFGQAIDDVKGVVADILPSRLHAIEAANVRMKKAMHPLFPQHRLDEFDYDLRLSVLGPLLKRPGGRKATAANESKQLFDLKRDLAAAIYHGQPAPERRLWAEVMKTARWHLAEATRKDDSWGILYEGYSAKKNMAFLTPAGWVRHLAQFLEYLRKVKVMEGPKAIYQPQSAALAPYFTEESAIDSREKAFAFILGVLYGKVMQVQAARGVNVGANALTWLKRLTLSGKDLPELYIKVREKLLAYETEGNEAVRDLVAELGALGAQVGDQPELADVQTCYFLLLGQSLATTILPSKGDGKGSAS